MTSYFLSVELAGGPSCEVVNSSIVLMRSIADAGRAQPEASPVLLLCHLGFHVCSYSVFQRCACPASCSFPSTRTYGGFRWLRSTESKNSIVCSFQCAMRKLAVASLVFPR